MLDCGWGNANYLFEFVSAENMKRKKQNCFFLSFYDQLFLLTLNGNGVITHVKVGNKIFWAFYLAYVQPVYYERKTFSFLFQYFHNRENIEAQYILT